MLYAKVVFGLPLEGPFDYLIPEALQKKAKPGCRASVFFGNRKAIGYIVALSRQSSVKNLKSIVQLLDEAPVISSGMLLLAKKLSVYYCCSWGEAIETMLPAGLRSARATALNIAPGAAGKNARPGILLVHSSGLSKRWEEVYLVKIREVLQAGRKVIIALPDIASVPAAEKIIRERFKNPVAVLLRNHPGELKTWVQLKENKLDIVIGTRSVVFAPFDGCGLIIVEEEQSYGYKQDQVPHYHARQAAIMRADIEGSAVILGSSAPSLETMHLAENKKIGYLQLGRIKKYPEIKVIDTKRLPLFSKKKNMVFSRYLEDSIAAALNNKEKVLLFLNRRGFATAAACVSCGKTVKCPRCSINLVFHYKENLLTCHYCNFKIEPPKLCPACNAGYLHYRGSGTEKIESEIARIFPQAKIEEAGAENDISGADIFVASQSIIKDTGLDFGLIGVLSIDNTLNHADFRSSEKAFGILSGLSGLTEKKMVIQTGVPESHIFRSLANNAPDIFYKEELRERRELKFPPFRHFGLLKLRGRNAQKVEEAARSIFDKLVDGNDTAVQAISVNPGMPLRLRESYYWQILLCARQASGIGKFLKSRLHGLRHSGIIITVDIDPI